MRINQADSNATERLESERETLPFPVGGVFTGQASTDPKEDTSDMYTSTDDVIASIDLLFDVMQEQIDTISEEVDHSMQMPACENDGFDPLPAA